MTSQTVPPSTADRPAETPVLPDDAPGPRVECDGEFVWLGPCPNPLRRPLAAIAWLAGVPMGVASLLALLTILAAVPVLNLFALGYLLEAEGRVARSGKLRHGLPLLPAATRLASIVVGVGLWLVPVWLLASAAADARLIAPRSTAAWLWTAALVVVAILVGLHLVPALARGGSLGCFLRPIKNVRWLREQLRSGDFWARADRSLRDFVAALRPWHHFRLGVLGFVGTWAWLALPTVLFTTPWDTNSTWQRLVTLVGGACLVPVLSWVPFLQVRLAAEYRWSAIFELRGMRELFRHAPLSWLLATAALYALSVPLFLYSFRLRMHAPLHGVWWDLALVSIVCTLPARAALAWAYHRATRSGPAWAGWVWFNRLLLAALLALYVWLLFHTPLTHEARPWQLEHHSLVLPIPW